MTFSMGKASCSMWPSRARKRIWLMSRETRLTPSPMAMSRDSRNSASSNFSAMSCWCEHGDHGVADLVGHAVGHGADEAEVGGLDFELAELFALREVIGGEQRGGGQGGVAALERDDADAVGHARGIFRFIP